MQQLFFIAPKGYPQVKASGVQSTHGWCAPGDDPTKDAVIGVVEIHDTRKDAEYLIDKLEEAGIMWLPNHLGSQTISAEHAEALAQHGVTASDTTASAMKKVFAKSGFNPHKPSRF
jgi:hypothetical protein